MSSLFAGYMPCPFSGSHVPVLCFPTSRLIGEILLKSQPSISSLLFRQPSWFQSVTSLCILPNTHLAVRPPSPFATHSLEGKKQTQHNRVTVWICSPPFRLPDSPPKERSRLHLSIYYLSSNKPGK
ncbi:hypothetical protein ILYODFUR_036151 [Ilyodon furcidens]|uniref:Uncharacterized protein n=1 Tax=Ilyodon furcidens TaxID=33524 RepID=A0ABV0U2C2_9TELE